MKRNIKREAIILSRRELIHLRRFLNRAVNCAEGACDTKPFANQISAWYYVKPLLAKVNQAIANMNLACESHSQPNTASATNVSENRRSCVQSD